MNTAHARSMPRVVRAAVRTLRWLLVAVLGRYFIENFMILVYDQRVGGTRPAPPHDCVFVSASAIVALRSPRQLLCSSRGYPQLQPLASIQN